MKQKYIIILILLIGVLFLIYIKNININKINDNVKNTLKIEEIFTPNKKIKNIIFNKTIIIGDSRMSLLRNMANEIDIPKNFTFIAEGGTKINWFKEYAKPYLERYLDKRNKKINYHVLINMGVNDLDSYYQPQKIADEYSNLYNQLAKNYPNIHFYILSVNPIDEKIIYKYIGKNQLRTTKKIIEFNNQIEKNLHISKTKNIKYCDSYNSIEFMSPDGLHYNSATNQVIINYIINNCLSYL